MKKDMNRPEYQIMLGHCIKTNQIIKVLSYVSYRESLSIHGKDVNRPEY
jgi:hypothetical protein